LDDAAKRYAFTIAGEQSEAVIAVAREGIDDALREGISQQEFGKRLRATARAEGLDPLSSWRIETVFRQNVMTALGAGRLASQRSAAVTRFLPHLEYHAVRDGRERANAKRNPQIRLRAHSDSGLFGDDERAALCRETEPARVHTGSKSGWKRDRARGRGSNFDCSQFGGSRSVRIGDGCLFGGAQPKNKARSVFTVLCRGRARRRCVGPLSLRGCRDQRQ